MFRYFHTTEAKFALLTNGIDYRFYTDLVTPNKMDDKPFFEFKITDIKENEVAELKKFHKSYFNVDNITNTASELKYLNHIKHLLQQDFTDPSDEFVKYFAKKVYPSTITQKVLEQFKAITVKACAVYVSDIINDKLKTVLQGSGVKETIADKPVEPPVVNETNSQDGIVTTEEEIMGYMIVKSILAEIVDIKRVVMRDALSYCAILLDDNNRKPICRFYFNTKKLSVGIMNADKNFVKYEITAPEDIYGLKEHLLAVVKMFLGN